jgi:hypothetical protein
MHIKINITEMNPLSPTDALVQNNPREPINTPIVLMDLAMPIYD